jgi:hypothetical protein
MLKSATCELPEKDWAKNLAARKEIYYQPIISF